MSFSFQTGMSAAVNVTFGDIQLMSHENCYGEFFTPLQGCDGKGIQVSGVYDLLSNIHDILSKDVSKWVSNIVCILDFLFYYTFRLSPEVWASVSLHDIIVDTIPPNEAFHYGGINGNWNMFSFYIWT